MRSQRARLRAAVTGAAVVALVAATGPNGAAAPPTAPNANTAGTSSSATPTGAQAVGESVLPTSEKLTADGTKVTLITGDVVSYSPGTNGGKPQVEVTSSRNASFTQVQEGDHFYVYPGDARGLVGAGKLDKMLFDVAYLAKNGYGDDKAKTLPVIVQYPKTTTTSGRPAGPASAATVAASNKALSAKADALPATSKATGLSVVNSAAVKVTKADTTTFWSTVDAPKPNAASLDAGVAKIWLDKKVEASLDVSVPQIGAPEAWAAGYDGTGIKVAVLDTGIDDTHPDFAGKIAESKSFIEGETTKDGFGHGTHVASIIVGSGAASDGKYKGVAPGAQLLVGKVLDNSGHGSDSQVIAGMTWAAQSDAKIISMSLGACCSDGNDPMAQAVNDLTAQYGKLFVIAAGNDAAISTIGSPGAADAALTVAAVDKQDQMAWFSSRGPRLGDAGMKPDIAGPGVDIVAARAEGTTMPGAVHVGEKYTTVSGTSMATPHVAGSAAILAQEHPDWTGEKIKQVLVSSSKDTGVGGFEQGAGRVDVARATTQQVYATGPVAFGRITPPHTAPASKPLTYVNDGDSPVTLNLTATSAAWLPAPDGMFTTNPSTVTVPAHGTASVDVLFDVTKNAPNTFYGGGVHAVSTDGGVTVNTAVGGQKQAHQAKLNLNIINRADMTDTVYLGYWLMRQDPQVGETTSLFSGPVQSLSATVDAGFYAIGSDVAWRDKNGEWNYALFTNPNVDATGEDEVNVTFDLRKAVQETVRTPKDSIPYTTKFGYWYQLEGDKGATGAFYTLPYGSSRIWSIPTNERPSHVGLVAYISRYNGVDPVKMTLRGKGKDGKVTLHPQYQAINTNADNTPVTMLDGRSTRQIVAVGAGHPEDFTGVDLRGKIALLDLSDICPVEPTETGSFCTTDPVDRVQAAKDAGAVAVLGYGRVGRQFLLPFSEVGRPGKSPTYPIPTMGITANEGRMLAARLAKRPVTVDIDATEWTPYLYPLAWSSHEQLHFGHKTVTDRDLLRTDHRVHTDKPGTPAALKWSFTAPIGVTPLAGASYRTTRPAPFTLTSYLGPLNQDVFWTENANGGNYSQSRYHRLTRAGSETQNWGEQPLVPSAYRADPANGQYGVFYCYSCRNGDIFLPSRVLTNNGTTTGTLAAGTGTDGKPVTEHHLYRTDGAEVTPKDGFAFFGFSGFDSPYYELPAEQTDYRLTESYTTPFAAQKWTPHVQTERTFGSQRVTDGIMPDNDGNIGVDCMGYWLLRFDNDQNKYVPVDKTSPCKANDELYLGYDFGLNLDNTLPAESRQNVTITGFGSPYLKTQPKLSTLTLSLSYDDGKTWQKAKVRANHNGTYTGTFTLPKLSTTTGAVTIRAEATDTHGNTVKQTVDRAFGINPATHGHGGGNAQ